MALPVNGARGEAPLRIGEVDLVIAATMEGLSSVSSRLECKSMASLFDRLANVEIAAAIAGIDLLTVRGDKKAALAGLKLGHFPAVAGAFAQALSHHFGDEGNAEAVEEAT